MDKFNPIEWAGKTPSSTFSASEMSQNEANLSAVSAVSAVCGNLHQREQNSNNGDELKCSFKQ